MTRTRNYSISTYIERCVSFAPSRQKRLQNNQLVFKLHRIKLSDEIMNEVVCYDEYCGLCTASVMTLRKKASEQ